jgi:DNA mismatch repair protein MSH6
VLKEGISPALDEQNKKIASIHALFAEQLRDIQKQFASKEIRYLSNASTKESFVLEIPEKCVNSSNIPSNWTELRGKKNWKRFQTPLGVQYSQDLALAHELREDARKEVLKDVLLKFDENYRIIMNAINCVSRLDCLQVLAGSRFRSNICTPKIVLSKRPYLKLIQGRHPCLEESVDNFVPNDVILGEYLPQVLGDKNENSTSILDETKNETKALRDNNEKNASPILLLTGPNMGGKSTLLRQCCVIVLMAQLGCDVTAEECEFSPVDRIFTRIGACDNIMLGRSTFMVELQEASSVLNSATKNSLVLLDELGRGTSTHDGYAIAFAVLKYLAEKIGCITLFSTHYHQLASEFATSSSITLKHMACLCEPPQEKAMTSFSNENEIDEAFAFGSQTFAKSQQSPGKEKNNDDQALSNVIFLYQARDGISPASYGLNVALMSGLPQTIVKHARKVANRFAESSGLLQNHKYFRAKRVYNAFKAEIFDRLKKEQKLFEEEKNSTLL